MDPFVVYLTVVIAGLGGFTGFLVRDYITDLKKQRDTALTGWQGQIAATEKLTQAVHDLATRGAK